MAEPKRADQFVYNIAEGAGVAGETCFEVDALRWLLR